MQIGTEVSEAKLCSLTSLLPVHLGSSRYQLSDRIFHGDSSKGHELQSFVSLSCEWVAI